MASIWQRLTARSRSEPDISVVVGGSVGGDMLVGSNITLTHIHEAPAEKPIRLRLVDGRPVGAVDLQERPSEFGLLTAPRTPGTPAVRILAGRRGVGKSQLAAQYSRLRDDEGWTVVAWFAAETEESMIAGWARLAEQIDPDAGPGDPAAAARTAIAWLDSQPGQALIVYDNAVDPDAVNRWRATGDHVEVLMTTNNRLFRSVGALIDVDVFGTEQAVGYLAARSGLADPAGASRLATDLGCLPLALAQAAALIGTDRRYRTYDAYRARLARLDVTAMLPRTPGDPYPRGVAEATLIAVAELAEKPRNLLDILALLSPDGVDIALIVAALPDADLTEDWLQDLVDRSLVTRSESGDEVLVHRMVQRVLRETARATGRFRQIVIWAANMMTLNLSLDVDAQWPMRDRFRNLGTQILTLQETILDTLGQEHGLDTPLLAILTDHIAWLAWHLGEVADPEHAIIIGERALADQESLLAEDDLRLFTTRNNLANAYRTGGRLGDAIALFEHNCMEYIQIFGPDDPQAIVFQSNVGMGYDAAGLHEDAIEVYEGALINADRLLDHDHVLALQIRINLGNALLSAGEPDRAIAVMESTIVDLVRVVGDQHQDTLSARNNLAHAYYQADRLDEAIMLHETNLADVERIHGADHIRALTERNNLAVAYQAAGRLDEAIPMLEANLAERMETLGTEHPATLVAGHNVANAYQAAGHLDAAITLFREVLEEALRLLGDEHPTTIMVQQSLDLALAEQAESPDASS